MIIDDISIYDRKWHKWFAYKPVTTISNNRIWLRQIYRYGEYNPIHGTISRKTNKIEPKYIYRYAETEFDILKFGE